MWSSLLDLYITATILIILTCSFNALTSMSAPVDEKEDGIEQGNNDDTNQEPNPEDGGKDAGYTTQCWETEDFLFIGPCAQCHPFVSKLTNSCHETGFNQLVHCSESNQDVYKSCPRSRDSIEESFWIFEGVTLIIGFIASLVVFFRRRKLNREAAERVRKQISNSV